MKRRIGVHLGAQERLVGEIRYDREGSRESAAFAYAAEWLAAADRFAIEPALPLVAGFQYRQRARGGSVFHAVVADTGPDGWGRKVIARDRAKRRELRRTAGLGETAPAPGDLDYLLAVDDFSRLGALRYRDEDGIFQAGPGAGGRRAPPLIELQHLVSATRAVETSTETAADLSYLRGRGTSLGGMRPKCTVVDDDGRLAIGKFPSVTDQRAVTKGEVLALWLAKRAGIDAAEARLVDSAGVPVALIRRFDRTAAGERVLYCSAATMLGADDADDGGHTYTDIVDALRVHGAAPQQDSEELWRRIAFSILIANVDDHLHNHGFLYAEHGRWRLSPAFDLNPFPDRVRELKTWISPRTGPESSIAALQEEAPYFLIAPARAREMLERIQVTVGVWRKVGGELGMTKTEMQDFASAFME